MQVDQVWANCVPSELRMESARVGTWSQEGPEFLGGLVPSALGTLKSPCRGNLGAGRPGISAGPNLVSYCPPTLGTLKSVRRGAVATGRSRRSDEAGGLSLG